MSAPDRRLALGILGVGHFGRFHALKAAANPRIRLVGLHDADPARAAAIGAESGAPALTAEALVAAAEAVIVAAPTRFHFALARAALEAGRHVFVEKPLAATLEEADGLIGMAQAGRRVLQVGHIERFSAAFRAVTGAPAGGRALSWEAVRAAPFRPRSLDVSVVLDLMIHDIDLLLELAAAPVVKLTASGSRAAHSGYLDYVTATLGFANGIVATLTSSKVTHRKIRRIAAHCKSSLTEADFLNNEILIHRQTIANCSTDYGQVLYRQDGLIEKVHTSNIEPLHAELEHFVGCVRGGNQPSVGGEQALKALRLASLIEQMALDGQAWQHRDVKLLDVNSSVVAV
jgi:predicted dehydrogenase